MTFDYKSYSLNQLKDWVHDAISSGDVTASEVYNAITSVVDESIDYHAQNLSNLQELHSLLNGKNDKEQYDAVMSEREYYEPTMPPWGHSDMEALRYTEEELNAMCDAAEAEEKKEEYAKSRLQDDYKRMQKVATMNYKEAIAAGWTMTDDGFWMPPQKDERVKKWILPVELSYVDGEEDYLLSLPTDLLESVDWKEGDQLEWIPQEDNSYILKKVNHEK